MEQSIHEFVVTSLQERTRSYAEIARDSGVSQRTVEKIARREIADPGVSSVEKLAKYFRDHPRESAA